MFGKDVEKLRSFLGAESEFQGNVTSKGILRIDGTFTGIVQADQVILSETAFVKGDIIAKTIVVGGKTEGTLRGHDLVEIKSKGKVTGDILTNKLLIMEGGELNGRVEMKAKESDVVDFESRGQQLALKN